MSWFLISIYNDQHVAFMSYIDRRIPTCRNIEHIWQLCWRLGFYRGGAVFMSALSGIDIALWDLKGR